MMLSLSLKPLSSRGQITKEETDDGKVREGRSLYGSHVSLGEVNAPIIIVLPGSLFGHPAHLIWGQISEPHMQNVEAIATDEFVAAPLENIDPVPPTAPSARSSSHTFWVPVTGAIESTPPDFPTSGLN